MECRLRHHRPLLIVAIAIAVLWSLVSPITFATLPSDPRLTVRNDNAAAAAASASLLPPRSGTRPSSPTPTPITDPQALLRALFPTESVPMSAAALQSIAARGPRKLTPEETRRQALMTIIQHDLAAVDSAGVERAGEWPRAPPYEPLPRLLVISIGGVGTTPLMMALESAFAAPHINVSVNSPVDKDGLKHVWVSAKALPLIRAFRPAAVLYLLGDPLPAIYSHFSRTWAGVQLCKVAPNASLAVRANADLLRLLRSYFFDPADFNRYCGIVAATGVDHFQVLEHAWSWVVDAPHLGVPVWFATLETVLNNQAVLRTLVRRPDAPLPLLSMQLFRNSSFVRNRPVVPPAVVDLYGSIYAELVVSLDGRCLGSRDPESWSGGLCDAAGAPRLDPAGLAWDARRGLSLPEAAPAVSPEGRATLELLVQCERLGPVNRTRPMQPGEAALRRSCSTARAMQPVCKVIRPQRPRRGPSPSRSWTSTPFKSPTPTSSPLAPAQPL